MRHHAARVHACVLSILPAHRPVAKSEQKFYVGLFVFEALRVPRQSWHGDIGRRIPRYTALLMRWLLDMLYLLAAVATSPVWLTRMIRTGKIRTDWRGRFGHVQSLTKTNAPRILLHAVSVGEVNAVRALVSQLADQAQPVDIVIATTTDTGYARAKALFGDLHSVVRYPFDFSHAVGRFLDAVQPDAVALVELEVWPNFVALCQKRHIPVCVINGRLTGRSYARYRYIKPLIARAFNSLRFASVQNEQYAKRFQALGVPSERLHITGTMKWDTAAIANTVASSQELAAQLGIDLDKPLIVAGSTAPGEHELLISAVPEGVQLLCAPRRPEWFEQAAEAMQDCIRRTGLPGQSTNSGRFLLDTIGELRQAYALADIVVVGRSFGTLHGSDMMEPIALGKPTVIGPAVADFQDTMDALLAGDGIIQTTDEKLGYTLRDLLANPDRRRELAANGRAVIRAHQGATARHVAQICNLVFADTAQENSPFQLEAETAKEKKEERT